MAALRSFAFLLLLAASGLRAQPAPEPQVPEPVRQQLLKLVANPAPAQARPVQEPVLYGANLWEYIDGAADSFLLYGLDGMIHQEFRAGPVSVTVDIYSMGAAENAFGIYAAERPDEAQFLPLGAEGYRALAADGLSGSLNFLLGPYYVKLLGFGAGCQAPLEAFARELAARIALPAQLPELLSLLPAEARRPHSELYVLSNPLGRAYLSPAYSVQYAAEKGNSTLLVSVASSPAEAQNRLGKLEAELRKQGSAAPAPELAEHALRGITPYDGPLAAAVAGRYLVLLLNPSGNAAAILPQTLARLQRR